MPVKPGLHATVELVVADADTALAMGTGSVPVLATPRLIALCEQASVQAVTDAMAPGQTSVGTKIHIDHLAATAVGHTVRAKASVSEVNGRRVIFTVSVNDERGLVAVGRVTRVLVDVERFLERTR